MKEGGLKYNDPLNIWDRNIIWTAYNSVFEKSLRFHREQFHANSNWRTVVYYLSLRHKAMVCKYIWYLY